MSKEINENKEEFNVAQRSNEKALSTFKAALRDHSD